MKRSLIKGRGNKSVYSNRIEIRLGTVWYWFQDAVINEVHFLIYISIKKNRLFSKWYWNPMMNAKQENEAWNLTTVLVTKTTKTWNNGNYWIVVIYFLLAQNAKKLWSCAYGSRVRERKSSKKMKTKANEKAIMIPIKKRTFASLRFKKLFSDVLTINQIKFKAFTYFIVKTKLDHR